VRPRVGDFPEVDEKGEEKWPKGDEKTWKTALRGITTGEPFFSPPYYTATDSSTDAPAISQSIVHHVQTSLARAPYNIDDFGAYQAAALSVRDNLIVSYDLFGCFKITARMLPLLSCTITGIYYVAYPILFPSAFVILGISAMKLFFSRLSLRAICEYDVLRANVSQSR
jgi:hypothetical protein